MIKKYEHDDDHLNKMLTLLKSQRMQENQKTQLYFALAKAFEDIRDYKKSFDFYIKGNCLRKKEFKYNIKEDTVVINALPDVSNIVKKLSWLIENPKERNYISKNARKFIEEFHDYKKIANKYLEAWVI